MLTRAISSTAVRLLFRVLFTIFFLYLGIVGNHCNKLAIKLRLLCHGKISVPEAAGWLQAPNIIDPIWHMRRIPNIKWWSLMAVIAVLSKLTDLATQTVRQALLSGFCNFDSMGTGMVVSTTGFDTFQTPPVNGRASFVAANAQLTSINNGCSQGIYKKVNSDPYFCAAESDLLGSWNCSAVGEDITYTYDQYTVDDVQTDLLAKGLLYGPNYAGEVTNNKNDAYKWTHLVVWSTSTPDDSKQAFSVKAAIDMTATETDDKVMHSMYCTMNAPGTFCYDL